MRGLVVPLSLFAMALAGCVEAVDVVDTNDHTAPGDRSRSAELWAHDPLRQTLDLATGDYGRYVRGGELLNRNSYLGFGLPNPGFLEVGIQGRETGVIVDLGPDAELAEALGAEHRSNRPAAATTGRARHAPRTRTPGRLATESMETVHRRGWCTVA